MPLLWGSRWALCMAQPSQHTDSHRQTPKKGAVRAVCCVGSESDRLTGGTGRGKVEFTLRANSRTPSANTLALAPGLCSGRSSAIGSGRARAGRGWLHRAQAVCQAAVKWNWEGMGFASPAPPPQATPKASVPCKKQADLTASHDGASSAPERSHNISPECWRRDLSLPRVPEQIRCGAMQKTSSESVCEWGGSPAPKGTAMPFPLGSAEYPKLTPAPNVTSLWSTHCPHATLQGWDAACGGDSHQDPAHSSSSGCALQVPARGSHRQRRV